MLRRLLLAVAVLLLSLAAVAAAGTYTLPDLRVGRGYVGPVILEVTWADGSARDVTSATGTVRVYASSGALRWTKPVAPAGSPANRMSFALTAAETGTLGTYLLELDLVEGGVTDALHGRVLVEGISRP